MLLIPEVPWMDELLIFCKHEARERYAPGETRETCLVCLCMTGTAHAVIIYVTSKKNGTICILSLKIRSFVQVVVHS